MTVRPESGTLPSPPPVRAADHWVDNSALIADAASLGYLDGWVLDPTYGRGLWWRQFRPAQFTICDIKTGVDFTNLPFDVQQFDAVAFDPPYVAKGGRDTSGIGEMDDRYGLKDAPKTPPALQTLINQGVSECARVLKWGGYLLVKTKPYISSGKYWDGPGKTAEFARYKVLTLVDQFIHVGAPGPQPPGRTQVHARNNYSVLQVFRKGRY